MLDTQVMRGPSSKPEPSRVVEGLTEAIVRSRRKAPQAGKDPLAVELGRRGGLKGGKARAQKLSRKKRREIARRAARARWKKGS